MNLDTTFWAIIAVLKMLDYTAFAKGVQALCHSGWLDQVPFTDITGDEMVEVLHQVFPMRCHCQITKVGMEEKQMV